jgi:putative endopeptidase
MALFRLGAMALAVLSALPAVSQQASTEKHQPALDVHSMDRRVDPCTDFFAYSCGGWVKNNPIPPDQAAWDTYSKMQDENTARLRGILEAASKGDPGRNAATQKIGDYYASCTDEQAIEAKGAQPLRPMLDRISKLSSKQELADVASSMPTANVLFRLESIQDFRDASQVVANADQGGLGLPDRDYYTKDDAKSQELRKQYVEHVQKMFQLLGDAPDLAAKEAQTVMRIETALAKGSQTRVERRDPKNLDHKMASSDLE